MNHGLEKIKNKALISQPRQDGKTKNVVNHSRLGDEKKRSESQPEIEDRETEKT